MAEQEDGRMMDRFWPSSLPSWLRSLGMIGWMIAGLSAGVYALTYVFSRASSIMIPLIVAFVIGVVARPLVSRLEKRGVPSSIAALLVLIVLVAVIVGVVWITVAGVISQWPQISAQVKEGVASLRSALSTLGFDSEAIQSFVDKAAASSEAAAKTAASGILSAVGSGLSGVIALVFGLFVGAALLYYVLSDYATITKYIDAHLGLPRDLGRGVATDAMMSLQGYFRGTTITGVVVALAIGAGVAVLGVPLAIPITLVTFLTCYIPFFGSIFSGIFAFLIAFGANGLTTALIVLAIILIAQNLLQTVVNARVMGGSLDLHPLVVLVITMLGGIFGGLLGAALAAPLLAMVLRANARIRSYVPQSETSGESPGPGSAAPE